MGYSCNCFKPSEIITTARGKHGDGPPEIGRVPKFAIEFDYVDGLSYIWYRWKEDDLDDRILAQSLDIVASFALNKCRLDHEIAALWDHLIVEPDNQI